MPDLIDLFLRWWKRVFLFAIIVAFVATVIVLIMPAKYLATATALPAASYSNDKTSVFSQNLQELYSALGSPDDLDRILGTARLDTVYEWVVEEFHIASGANEVAMAGRRLKRNTSVIRNDYGELQVKVWDVNKNRAATLANAIMDKLQQMHQEFQTANNSAILSRIKEAYGEKQFEYQKISDSLQHSTSSGELLSARKNSLIQQIQEYQKLIDQYRLMVDSRPRALIEVERAKPALQPDKPEKALIIAAASILALLFGFFTALVLERRRNQK